MAGRMAGEQMTDPGLNAVRSAIARACRLLAQQPASGE
jgi:hypothetical protein